MSHTDYRVKSRRSAESSNFFFSPLQEVFFPTRPQRKSIKCVRFCELIVHKLITELLGKIGMHSISVNDFITRLSPACLIPAHSSLHSKTPRSRTYPSTVLLTTARQQISKSVLWYSLSDYWYNNTIQSQQLFSESRQAL